MAVSTWSDARIDAWVLCAEFVERIVSDARAEAANGSSVGVPDVDWAAIWRAGDGAPSDEAAIGRIVRAASEAAQAISRQQSGAPPSPVDGPAGVGVLAAPPPAVPGGIAPDVGAPGPPVDQVQPGIVGVPVGEPYQTPHPSDLAPPFIDSEIVPPAAGASVGEPYQTSESAFATSVVQPVIVPPDESTVERPATSQPQESPTAQVGVIASATPLSVPPALGDESDLGVEAGVSGEDTHTESLWFHVFTWSAVIGVIILLFLAWQLWGTSISQHHAQSQLKSQFEALEAQHAKGPHGSKTGTLISAATRVSSPADGTVVAEIQIPAIGVDQYVVEGTDESDLSKGPGHYIGTAMPGQAGNVAIAGHRTTNGAPFNGLGHLVPGDRIILTTIYAQSFTYVVSGTPQAVSPSDVGVLNYFGDNRVTLTTCNPEYSSTQRLVVVGKLKGAASPGVPVKNLSYHVASPGTASWNWSLLPAIGVEISLLVLLALSYRRFGVWFAGNGKWFVLAPLWAAGLYLLFTTLTGFLPAAF